MGWGCPSSDVRFEWLGSNAFSASFRIHSSCSIWERLVVAHLCHGRVSYVARLVAAMRTHGITRLLTLNTADFARFPGLTLIDPTAGSPPAPPIGP